MRTDWRRQVLQLPSVGELSEAAVRAAYWRLVAVPTSSELARDNERLREAKRQLLFELGVRVPTLRNRRHGQDI
jgi:hypothetical protein